MLAFDRAFSEARTLMPAARYRLHYKPQPERARSQTRLDPDGSKAPTMSGMEPQYSFGRGWVRRSAAIHEEAV